jgi:ribosomal protein L29
MHDNTDLEQLENLVLNGGFDEESRKQVKELRRQFEDAVAKEELTKYPAVAAYIAYLKSEIARCNTVLSEDEGLTEFNRMKLFERKKACHDFLNHFGGDTAELDKTIKDLLHVAQNS